MILSVSVPYQKFGPLCSILLGHYQIGPLLITCSQVVAIIYAVYFCLLPLDSLDNNLFCLSSLAPQTVSGGPPSYICRLSGKSDVDWSFWLEVMIICPASKPMGITARLFFLMFEFPLVLMFTCTLVQNIGNWVTKTKWPMYTVKTQQSFSYSIPLYLSNCL